MLTSEPARLARIDLVSGKRQRTRFEADFSGDLAAGAGSIWATLVDTDQLVRIDPRTWNVTTIAVGREPNGIVSSRGSIWVANRTSSTVSRVDPRTGRVKDEIEVPLNPYELAADRSGVWVTSLAQGSVTRIRAPAG
jgi:YVTN family beta-propeller protein